MYHIKVFSYIVFFRAIVLTIFKKIPLPKWVEDSKKGYQVTVTSPRNYSHILPSFSIDSSLHSLQTPICSHTLWLNKMSDLYVLHTYSSAHSVQMYRSPVQCIHPPYTLWIHHGSCPVLQNCAWHLSLLFFKDMCLALITVHTQIRAKFNPLHSLSKSETHPWLAHCGYCWKQMLNKNNRVSPLFRPTQKCPWEHSMVFFIVTDETKRAQRDLPHLLVQSILRSVMHQPTCNATAVAMMRELCPEQTWALNKLCSGISVLYCIVQC